MKKYLLPIGVAVLFIAILTIVCVRLFGTGPGLCVVLATGALLLSCWWIMNMIRSIWNFKVSKEQTSTRVHAEELRHEYRMVTRYLRDLENDFLVGKVSQADYASMRQTYRERAMRLLAQLDQSVPVEQHIAADLASRRLTTPSAVGGIS